MLVDELELLVQNAQSFSQFYLLNPTGENNVRLEESITKLVYVTADLDPTARLPVAGVSEFLLQCKQILASAEASHSMRSRLCLLFSNFALHNVDVRRFLCSEARLCDPVFCCLQTLVDAQLGPQNVIDVLRLLQLLTYEKCLSLSSWTNDALGFLVAEVLKVDSSASIDTARRDTMDHPLPYCLTILCNLVARSRLVANRVKKMGSFKQLCRRLLDFLQNNSRTVVVCSLVLIGHLDERIRDTIFSPQNIAQSFLCIFNVLGCADSLMTIHIAVDLLKRLIVAVPACGPCTLTTTAKNFTYYQFFEKSMQRTAGLLTSVDPRSEEAEAVFDLLLSLCRVNDIRQSVCAAIIGPAVAAPAGERRPLSAPLAAMARIAAIGCADAIRPALPFHALRMLTFVIREAIEKGVKVGELISSSTLCDLVESSVKSVIETKSALVKYQCMRITEGLRLAEAVVNDEDARQDLLNVVNAPLCAHINESQLISNPIVGFVNKLRSSANTAATRPSSNELPEWSLSGAAIPLQLLRLLATLKDYSKMHKDLYWRSLKDGRIVPFVAFAIAQGDDELVYDAFVLFTHCAQVPEFPIRHLSDLVATCTMELRVAAGRRGDDSRSSSSLLHHHQNGTSCESLSDYTAFADVAAADGRESFRQLDELLEKMKSGMDLKDVRTSQLVCAFEKKVAMHVSRERELEQLISMKEQALSQSERLRNICQQNRGDSEEIQNLRLILGDLEKQLAEVNERIARAEVENQEQLSKIAKLKKVLELERSQRAAEFEQFQRDRTLLLDENEKERELQNVLRQRFDEMAAKFDIASKATLDKQRELELSTEAIRECQQRQTETEQRLSDTIRQLTESKSAVQTQSEELDRHKAEITRLVEENKKLQKIKLAMAQMLND